LLKAQPDKTNKDKTKRIRLLWNTMTLPWINLLVRYYHILQECKYNNIYFLA
jgi:hypothetical protein